MSISDPKSADTSIWSLLTRLWRHLSRRRQVQLGLLLVIMLASALSEMISLGAVLPFIGILTAPEKVFNYPLVHDYAARFGFTEPSQLVLPITIAFGLAALGAGAVRLAMLWVSIRLAFATGADLSMEVYRRTLYQPYPIHLARNSSDVVAGIMIKTSGVAHTIQYLLSIMSSVLILILLAATLIVIDPIVVSTAVFIFGFSYGCVTLIFRKSLESNSEIIARESTNVVKALQEGLGGIRDVLLLGAQKVFCNIYKNADQPYRRAIGVSNFIAVSPRFAMEAIGMVLIATLAYLLSKDDGIANSLPVLGALALGAQRLLPVLQLAYSNLVLVFSNKGSLLDVLNLLDQKLPAEAQNPEPEALSFQKSIVFENVKFKYVDDGPWIINGVNLTIQKGSRIGFVGATGGGKSTLLDLLMGLLQPSEGKILVDSQPIIGKMKRPWQRCIAHVPQSIFLADTTVAENIAFGTPLGEIDMAKVREAARQAQISGFIESLSSGYDELVGERGVRLSGGQRQRIGIARALYRDASVLIFDEATSALDNSTEQAVMEAISLLHRDLTILLIAHRLTTVQRCDRIVELDGGMILAEGNYDKLLDESPSFRMMVKAVA